MGHAWGRVRCVHAPAGVRAGACAGGTGACSYMARVCRSVHGSHTSMCLEWACTYTCVTLGHMCPDTPDLPCTFAQMCMEPVHTPTNTHAWVWHECHTHAQASHTCVRQAHLHSCAWTRHTDSSGTCTCMCMDLEQVCTHMQGTHSHVHTCMCMHLTKLYMQMCMSPVHTCMGQTYKDQTHVHTTHGSATCSPCHRTRYTQTRKGHG